MMKKTTFITGASTGIGRALALEIASPGERIALIARRKELLDELAVQLEQKGSEVFAFAGDVADQAQVKRSIAETLDRFGRIDLAILSAGISERTDAASFKAENFERLLRTNLLGVAYCLEELLPAMGGQSSEKVIAAISSLAGDRGVPGSAGYCATKAALSTLFDGLRIDLKKNGIRLVTIEPGYVLTPMTENFGKMPFMMQADESARLILKRLARGDRVIRFPLIPSMAMKVVRMLPVSLFDLMASTLRPVRLDQGDK